MLGDMSSMRVLHQSTGQVRQVRVLSSVEKQTPSVELPGRKVVKKKKRILSGLMVGPINPKCWEAPDLAWK